jgi:transcription elongation factor GreA
MTSALQTELPRSHSWPGDSRAGSRSHSPRALITAEGERALRATLERLRHQLEVDFAGRMRDDRGFGEIAGNDEYLQTLEEASVIASRIASLENLLESATVVLESRASSGMAVVGTAVEVEDVSTGAVHEHRLIGDYEELRPNAVSASSPVGQALMGHSPGDLVEVELPGGKTRTLRILAVQAGSAGEPNAARENK